MVNSPSPGATGSSSLQCPSPSLMEQLLRGNVLDRNSISRTFGVAKAKCFLVDKRAVTFYLDIRQTERPPDEASRSPGQAELAT